MSCKNCGNQIQGNFCSNCGQNSKVDRLNLKTFSAELADSVFQVNRGFFYTLKELFIRPGHSIREFLDGRRKFLFKPIAYVFTFSTLYFLISKILDSPTLIDDFISGFSSGVQEENSTIEIPLVNWLSNNYAYTTLLLIPIFSLASYISFWGLKKNYLEHLVINSYITGQQAIFYIFCVLVNLFFDNNEFTVLFAVVISMLFNSWTYIQFFNNEKKVKVIFRLISTYFLFYILFSISMLLLLLPYIRD